MRKILVLAIAAALGGAAGLVGVEAAEQRTQTPIEIVVDFGTENDDFMLVPRKLTLRAGQLYRLVLRNPSGVVHYVSGRSISDAVRTRGIEVGGGDADQGWFPLLGPSVDAWVWELERGSILLRPGKQVAWVFVPIQTGSYRFGCAMRSHVEAGMLGEITVIAPPPA